MRVRTKAVIICIEQTIVFGLITIVSALILFHAFILAAPLWAALWTFWGFSVFTIITNVIVKFTHKLVYALLNFVITLNTLFLLITITEHNIYPRIKLIPIIASIPIISLYIFWLVKTIKIYFPLVKKELSRCCPFIPASSSRRAT